MVGGRWESVTLGIFVDGCLDQLLLALGVQWDREYDVVRNVIRVRLIQRAVTGVIRRNWEGSIIVLVTIVELVLHRRTAVESDVVVVQRHKRVTRSKRK